MGQSATSPRVLSGAEEFDRRMRSIAQAQNAHSDAMAELARLVGRGDPFATAPDPVVTEPVEIVSPVATDPGEELGAPVEPAVVHNTVDPETWERIVSQYPSITPKDEPVPDQWALALDDEYAPAEPGAPGAPPVVAVRDPAPAGEPENARRTLTVLAAVVVLTAGGLGASFLARPGSSAVSTATAAPPTIVAAAGPAKIQPEPQAADAPSEPSTLLDKSGSDGTAAAKVVNTVEQPVDLAQAVKPAPAAVVADAAPVRPSAFPEPRKVRTVVVRPDGSIMADSASTAAAVPADANALPETQQASLAFDPKTALPPPPAAARQPSAVEAALAARSAPPAETDAPAAETPARTPSGKTTARATPRASTSQDTAAQARSPVATPKSKPHVATKPKPVAEAPATDAASPQTQVAAADPAPAVPATDATPTSALGGSGFSIQLGAAPSQAEGDAAAARLAQKYGADLNGASPVVRKAQAGSKTVYRIRVGNLSQDGAKALCAKVQASGGGCFVARN